MCTVMKRPVDFVGPILDDLGILQSRSEGEAFVFAIGSIRIYFIQVQKNKVGGEMNVNQL